jgi:hypothetical protein
MKFNRLAASALMLVLTACAQPAAYQPAERDNGPGYSDERLAENRYRVTFTGNSSTRRETVENFLLLRAAEVTRDAGYGWFVFDDRDVEAKTTYRTMFTGFPGWGPGFGFYRHSWIYDPWDPYWQRDTVTVPRTRYQAYAEIVLLTPEQAKADAHALNAADVITRIGPQAAPPPAH